MEELRWFIADSLRSEEASSVEDKDEKIDFTVGFFRPFWNRKLLSSIYGGEVILQDDTQKILIKSRLKFTDTLIIASVVMGGLAIANYRAISMGAGHLSYYVIAWLWLVCGNIAISVYRWRRFIRQCVSEAADRVIIPRGHLMANPRSDHDRT